MVAAAPAHTEKRYYTYTYAYPDGTVFYVGKGSDDRIDDHEREARRGCQCKKCCTIRQIWQNGESVQKRIVHETFVELDALIYEWALIYLVYRVENLTNNESYRTGNFYIPRRVGAPHSYHRKRPLPPISGPKRTFNELMKQAGLTTGELLQMVRIQNPVSNIHLSTIQKMEKGKPITRLNAYRVLNVLSERLGVHITEQDVDDLKISGE